MFSRKWRVIIKRKNLCCNCKNINYSCSFLRYISIKLIFLYRKHGYNYDRVLIVGGGDVAKSLHDFIFSDDILGIKLLGVFSDSEPIFKTNVNILKFNRIKDFSIENKIDEIYYTLPLTNTNEIQDLVDFADQNLIRFKLFQILEGFLCVE